MGSLDDVNGNEEEAKTRLDANEFIAGFNEGELTVDEIGRGMHLCFRNAKALTEDAEILLERSPARSISLSILALEEIGKIILLAEIAPQAANGPISWKEVNRQFKLNQHRVKQRVVANYGKRIMRRMGKGYDIEMPGGLVPLLDRLKQLGFYVDCFRGQFGLPDDFGRQNKDHAHALLALAKERVESFEGPHGTERGSLALARMASKMPAMLRTVVALEDASEETIKETIRPYVREALAHDPGASER